MSKRSKVLETKVSFHFSIVSNLRGKIRTQPYSLTNSHPKLTVNECYPFYEINKHGLNFRQKIDHTDQMINTAGMQLLNRDTWSNDCVAAIKCNDIVREI